MAGLHQCMLQQWQDCSRPVHVHSCVSAQHHTHMVPTAVRADQAAGRLPVRLLLYSLLQAAAATEWQLVTS
jgi:hypothetical protein